MLLDDVTVDVDGEGITCVLGPSGAGKSTLLRLGNRLIVPDEGQVRFRGTPLDDLDVLVLRREVGMVFQRPTVFAGTVRQNLEVVLPDADEAEHLALLESVDLDRDLLDRTADDLSGGEAQRLCLARALGTRPHALLMDEPTSALDPAATEGLERLARGMATDGTPIVWVTHDLAQADRLAEHTILLVGGRVAAVGSLSEVRRAVRADAAARAYFATGGP